MFVRSFFQVFAVLSGLALIGGTPAAAAGEKTVAGARLVGKPVGKPASKAVARSGRKLAGKSAAKSARKVQASAASRKAAKASKGKRQNIAYKTQQDKISSSSFATTGIKNLRQARATRNGRMSTAADMSKAAVANFGLNASFKYGPGTIVISNYTRRLYYVVRPGRTLSYPIATPRPEEVWTGTTKVSDKKVDPDWYPTPDMRESDPEMPEKVPGGHPANPLGPRALYLGNSLYRIHGTNSPKSIGSPASGGCYRMHNNHIRALFSMVRVGTPVVVSNSRSL